MSRAVTDAVLLAKPSPRTWSPPASCKSNHRIKMPPFEGAGNKISPNLQPWQSCLHYTEDFPPKEDVTTKMIACLVSPGIM